jgi:hypothetical protein
MLQAQKRTAETGATVSAVSEDQNRQALLFVESTVAQSRRAAHWRVASLLRLVSALAVAGDPPRAAKSEDSSVSGPPDADDGPLDDEQDALGSEPSEPAGPDPDEISTLATWFLSRFAIEVHGTTFHKYEIDRLRHAYGWDAIVADAIEGAVARGAYADAAAALQAGFARGAHAAVHSYPSFSILTSALVAAESEVPALLETFDERDETLAELVLDVRDIRTRRPSAMWRVAFDAMHTLAAFTNGDEVTMRAVAYEVLNEIGLRRAGLTPELTPKETGGLAMSRSHGSAGLAAISSPYTQADVFREERATHGRWRLRRLAAIAIDAAEDRGAPLDSDLWTDVTRVVAELIPSGDDAVILKRLEGLDLDLAFSFRSVHAIDPDAAVRALVLALFAVVSSERAHAYTDRVLAELIALRTLDAIGAPSLADHLSSDLRGARGLIDAAHRIALAARAPHDLRHVLAFAHAIADVEHHHDSQARALASRWMVTYAIEALNVCHAALESPSTPSLADLHRFLTATEAQ